MERDAWPSRFGSGSLTGRARLPLTSQVEGDGSSAYFTGRQVSQIEHALRAARGELLEPKRQSGRDQACDGAKPAGQAG